MNQDRVGSVVSLRVRENKILRPLIQMTDGRHSATVEPGCAISQKKIVGVAAMMHENHLLMDRANVQSNEIVRMWLDPL